MFHNRLVKEIPDDGSKLQNPRMVHIVNSIPILKWYTSINQSRILLINIFTVFICNKWRQGGGVLDFDLVN